MTENKRFYTTRHHHESGAYKMVHDKSERFSFPRATRDSDLFLHCMNTLAEENKELKSFNQDLSENLSICANARISRDNRIKRLQEKIQRERTSFTKTHERYSKEAENKIKELSDENEELKKEVEMLRNGLKAYDEALPVYLDCEGIMHFYNRELFEFKMEQMDFYNKYPNRVHYK